MKNAAARSGPFRFGDAGGAFLNLALADACPEFLTLPAYSLLQDSASPLTGSRNAYLETYPSSKRTAVLKLHDCV